VVGGNIRALAQIRASSLKGGTVAAQMLTIDRIIEKYRGIHRTPAPAEQVERFRADLVSQSRAEQISSYLWLFGSHKRSIPLLHATAAEPPEVFWPVFLDCCACAMGFGQCGKSCSRHCGDVPPNFPQSDL
jgi:hypothetical protein